MTSQRELFTRVEFLLLEVVAAVSGCGDPVSSWAVEHDENEMTECDCPGSTGHAFARVARIFPTGVPGAQFPQQSSVPLNCAHQIGALVELGIYRCAATLGPNGEAPDPDTRTAESERQVRDASVVYRTITANAKPNWAKFPIVLQPWTPVATQGGCFGGFWSFYIDVALCQCGPE